MQSEKRKGPKYPYNYKKFRGRIKDYEKQDKENN